MRKSYKVKHFLLRDICPHSAKVEPGMWLFITINGVEPTNNAAEQAIRPDILFSGIPLN